jgi:hypothetical protein
MAQSDEVRGGAVSVDDPRLALDPLVVVGGCSRERAVEELLAVASDVDDDAGTSGSG